MIDQHLDFEQQTNWQLRQLQSCWAILGSTSILLEYKAGTIAKLVLKLINAGLMVRHLSVVSMIQLTVTEGTILYLVRTCHDGCPLGWGTAFQGNPDSPWDVNPGSWWLRSTPVG